MKKVLPAKAPSFYPKRRAFWRLNAIRAGPAGASGGRA
jgi:hypothetical protein